MNLSQSSLGSFFTKKSSANVGKSSSSLTSSSSSCSSSVKESKEAEENIGKEAKGKRKFVVLGIDESDEDDKHGKDNKDEKDNALGNNSDDFLFLENDRNNMNGNLSHFSKRQRQRPSTVPPLSLGVLQDGPKKSVEQGKEGKLEMNKGIEKWQLKEKEKGNGKGEETEDESVKLTYESSNYYVAFTGLEEGWKTILGKEGNKPYFTSLMKFLLAEERSRAIIYPPQHQVFNAFNLCPWERVKVVILGQDPYHGPGQAHGLAFSVQRGVRNPPSLNNIFKEAVADINIQKPSHGNLEQWSQQGVLLLNTCLTVRKSQAFSHKDKGWEKFTAAVINEINVKKEGIIFVLWGKPSQVFGKNISRSKHIVFTSSHPSPLSCFKTNEPFIGSKVFSKINAALKKLNRTQILWQT